MLFTAMHPAPLPRSPSIRAIIGYHIAVGIDCVLTRTPRLCCNREQSLIFEYKISRFQWKYCNHFNRKSSTSRHITCDHKQSLIQHPWQSSCGRGIAGAPCDTHLSIQLNSPHLEAGPLVTSSATADEPGASFTVLKHITHKSSWFSTKSIRFRTEPIIFGVSRTKKP